MFVLGENHFRKCFSGNGGVWLVWKIEFSGNWFPLTEKKWLWLRKSFYTFIFTSKYFRKKRERERERASAREEEDRAPVQSDDRRRTLSSSSRRSHELQSDDCDPRSRSRDVNCDLAKIAISRHRSWSRDVDCDLVKIAISRRRSRSRLREIAPSIAIDSAVVGLELAKHRAVEPSRSLMIFFSRLCPCFSGFVFSFFFSKHQKIFFGKFFEMQPNTWKHFPFRKIAFPENGIFSGNAFTRTKHSLNDKFWYFKIMHKI